MFEHLKKAGQNTQGFDPALVHDVTQMLLRGSVSQAIYALQEIERFSLAFPEPDQPQTAAPRFTWEQLERQLMFLAGTPQRRALASDRVAAIRRSCGHKPEEMILQEILIAAWVLLDEEPHGPVEELSAPDSPSESEAV
ncbi:MAG: hypothetical protein ACYDD1_10620 [Caulobacteraceae bacterium]